MGWCTSVNWQTSGSNRRRTSSKWAMKSGSSASEWTKRVACDCRARRRWPTETRRCPEVLRPVVNLNQVVPRLKWEWAGNHGDLVNRENREAATEVARVEEVETVAVNEAAAAGTATVAAVLSIVVETAAVIAEATEVVTVAVSSGACRS